MLPNSSPSPPTTFIPRREFTQPQKQVSSSFALLAISGSSAIRLYSFPFPIIVHLRRFLDHANLIAGYREDVTNNFSEFALHGRPFTSGSSKSVSTERVLLEVLSIVYFHGFTYLSTIDYGREPEDRLVMTFAKPAARSGSPGSPGSGLSSEKAKRAPFALSFPSSTMLRVVCPPLDSTPAILASVRGSWPRGVVSERKVGDNTFEFKLKGYSWFQRDTFAVDSLRHILSLLSSLDAHSFTLLASLSLTNRSRVKDLWLFTSPAPSDDVAYPNSPASSNADLKRPVHSPDLPPYFPSPQPNGSHRRLATDPPPTVAPQFPSPHVRAVTEDPGTHMPTLRKPAPRAQLPVSVVHDEVDANAAEAYRAQLPSTVPSGVDDMTGVGASHVEQTPDVFYSTSPFHDGPRSPQPIHRHVDEHSRTPTPTRPQTEEIAVVDRSPRQSEAGTPPLLGLGVFRDSAFSSSTGRSTEIPIQWTGVGATLVEEAEPTPDFPGGWQPTPVEEKGEANQLDITLDQRTQPEQPIQEVLHRVASPAFSDGEAPRKSEAGLIGVIASDIGKEKVKEKEDNGAGGQGWVLVNIEGQPVPQEQAGGEDGSHSNGIAPTSATPSPKPSSKSAKVTSPPAARAIVIVDALESKHKKSKSEQAESPSRMRRFFSMSRKDSKLVEGELNGKEKSKDNRKLKDRSMSDASRKTARRSIDG